MKSKKSVLLILVILMISIYLIYQNKKSNEIWTKSFPSTIGNTCTVFLIDGLSNEIFQKELLNGKLPNLALLIDSSTYTNSGICSFPTMTGYGFYPFITGQDATLSGILGLRWFDRSLDKGNLRNYVGKTNVHMNEDIIKLPANFFELSYPLYTASINTYMNRGAAHKIMTGWDHTSAKYEGLSIFKYLRMLPWFGHTIAMNHFEHETQSMQLAKRQLAKNPKFQWITLPSPDAYNHVFGTDSTYLKLLWHIDSLIGDFRIEIKKLGQQNARMLAIVSDHGISDVNRNIDIPKYLNEKAGLVVERGKSVHFWSSKLDEPLSNIQHNDCYFVINGNLCAYLYCKNPNEPQSKNWSNNLPYKLLTNYPKNNKTYNLLELLSQNEDLELIINKKNDSIIEVRTGHELAYIIQSSHHLKYQTIQGNPLQYPSDLINNPLQSDEWLNLTTNTLFPYAVPRLYAIMQQKGIGDIIITSKKGIDLANDYEIFVGNYKGGHGGLRKDVISVPYILYIPNQRPKTVQALRNEDVGLMIGKHLGYLISK